MEFDQTGRYVMSVNQGAKIEQIGVYNQAKVSKMDMLLINNTGNVCDNISMLVRIPYKGNRAVLTGEELGTTQDTMIRTYIMPQEELKDKFKIYYSENPNATRKLQEESNGWMETMEDVSKIKSCLIVGNDYQMQPGDFITFTYQLEIPANISYNNTIASNFATYYTEHSEETTREFQTQSDVVGITTGKGPELKISQEVVGADEEGKVNEMGILKYKVIVSNTGTETARDVVITDKLPRWTTYVHSVQNNNYSFMNVEAYPGYGSDYISADTMRAWNVIDNGDFENSIPPTIQWTVPELNPGEYVVEEFEVQTAIKPNIYQYYKDYVGFSMEEDGQGYISTKNYDLKTDSVLESKRKISTVPEIEIKNIATVTAGNFAAELKAAENSVTLKDSNLQVTETRIDNQTTDLKQGKETGYTISIVNSSSAEAKNIKIEKILPEGLIYESGTITKYTDVAGGDFDGIKQDLEYDEETRKITTTIDTLGTMQSCNIKINVTIDNLPDGVYEKEITSNTKVIQENTKDVSTNNVIFKVIKPELKVTQECSNNNKYLREGEIFTYILNIKNIGTSTAKGVTISQNVPEQLQFIKGTYNLFGNNNSSTYLNEDRIVRFSANIKPGEEVTLRIDVKVLAVDEETPIVWNGVVGGNEVEVTVVNDLEQTIEKSANSSNTSNGNNSNNGDNSNSGNSGNHNVVAGNKISGIAWLDENEDGQRDANEMVFPNITVTAIDTTTGGIAKKISGEDAVVQTNEQGEYIIDNLKERKLYISIPI